ncbi:MAG: insulinase family protein, partial [Planctomycetota bacterium]
IFNNFCASESNINSGDFPLDELEKRVRDLFSKIPKNTVKPFLVSEKLMSESSTLRLVLVNPVKEMRALQIHIPLPSQEAQVRSKTNSIFGMAMGDESAGSLLSLLKAENLATSLSAGLSEDTRFYGSFNIGIELTEKGFANYEQVLEWCFGYIRLMKQSEFPRYLWEENKTMSQIGERYAPKEEGSDLAIKLSSTANQHGLEDVERLEYIYTEPDTHHYFETLEQLQPEKSVVFMMAQGQKTNQVEKYYRSEYSVTEERGAFFEKLKKAQPHPKLALPKSNPFIPSENTLLPEQPILLVKNAQTTLWYLQDTEFGHPKVTLYFHILSPTAYSNVRNASMTELYTRLIREQLNEYSYPALMAGLSYDLSSTKQGVLLTIGGYSASAMKLLQVVSRTLKKIDFSEENFQTVYQKYLLELKNFPFSASTTISREVSRTINLEVYFSPQEQLTASESFSLEDVKQYIHTFYSRNHIQSLCCGNLSAEQAKQAVSSLWQELGSKPCSSELAHQDRVLWLSAGSDFNYKGTLPTNNSCLRIEYTVGTDDLQTQAASLIFDQAIRNYFYTEMRTKQMLGYVVFSGSYLRERVQNLFFLIQSGTHPAQELFQRADLCLAEINTNFDAMLAPQFEDIRHSLIEELSKKPKSISEKAQKFYGFTFDKEGDFLYAQKLIEAIRKTTPEEVAKLFRKTLDAKSRRRVTILLNAQQHSVDETKASIQDIKAFHQQCTFDK